MIILTTNYVSNTNGFEGILKTLTGLSLFICIITLVVIVCIITTAVDTSHLKDTLKEMKINQEKQNEINIQLNRRIIELLYKISEQDKKDKNE